jgi:hypothetical protein
VTSRADVYGASPVKRYRRTKTELADLDDAIVSAVEQDRPVSLRGVFYRVVSAGAVPKTENGYEAVGRRLLALRRDGRVDYWDIVDGTRWVVEPTTYDSARDALRRTRDTYRQLLWADQDTVVQIYSEKDAITGVVKGVTASWDVPLGIVRGYASESFAYRVADSIERAFYDDKRVYVYQLGDHDPSGVNAWLSFENVVRGFLDIPDSIVTFERIAVTPEQIREMNLPTRPTKASDSRSARFHGESVEVDAIPAPELRRIVEESITRHIDQEQLRLTRVAENSEREVLDNILTGLA